MGVYGLWRLLDATGKQVPLETLEGKVLGIDISIWIHQVLQGYQDRFGNPKPNAHLIGLFNRICKLLYYKIKPVFVFDGGVPMLKKDTIALRRKQKSIAKNKAEQMRTELITNLIKHSAVKTVLSTENQSAASDPSEVMINLQTKRTADDMFKLPDMPSTSKIESSFSDDYDSDSDSDSSDHLSPRKQTKWAGNIHSVDVTGTDFRALPADVRYEILTDLKETRKQNSWGRLHEMPEESHEFSGFQMKRLLKRRLVQESLECAEKEMGGKTLTLDELDKLLTEQGINTSGANCTYRIAGDSTTRLIYISDKDTYIKNNSTNADRDRATNNEIKKDEIMEEAVAGPSKMIPISEDINEYEFSDAWDSDVEMTTTSNFTVSNEISSDEDAEVKSQSLSKKYLTENGMNPALAYMLEYSGLTEKQIITFLEQSKKESRKGLEKISETAEKSESQNLTPEPTDNITTSTTITTIFTSTVTTTITTVTTNSNSNDTIREQVEPVKTTNSKGSPETVFFKTSAEVNMPSTEETNISSNTPNESQDTAVLVSTDSSSDSDDFIEIQDVPVPESTISINKSVSQQAIQITFRSDEKVEDDMFADVFGKSTSERSAKVICSELLESSQKSINSNGQELKGQVSSSEASTQSSKNLDTEVCQSRAETIVQSTNETKDTSSPKDITNHTSDIEIVNIEDDAIKDDQDDSVKNVTPIPMTEDELLSLQAQLEEKQTELMANIGKLERQGIDISDQIRIEAQELLRLFGIPYIVAPMEAEAQCAYLEQIHLTDGTITDDSDIWLFGGQCVYKNFFDNNKKVLEFRSCDIQHHFKLTRNDMIRLALLVGSDYTTGLAGIGPVTALEILGAFPSESDDLLRGLTNFCSWVKAGRAAGPGKGGLRNKLQNLEIQKGFPSQAVVQAYLFPKVDESKETFSWGKFNNLLLADYAKRKFGWDTNKYNKVMAPVLKRLEEKKSQSTMDAYFKLQTVPKSIEMTLSKRVQKAVQRLNNENTEEPVGTQDDTAQTVKKVKPSNEKRRTKKQAKNEQIISNPCKPTVLNVSPREEKNVEEYIPQREKNKANALKNKLHAIEVLRKSKQGLCKTKKVKRCVRKVKEEANLSESDSSSS